MTSCRRIECNERNHRRGPVGQVRKEPLPAMTETAQARYDVAAMKGGSPAPRSIPLAPIAQALGIIPAA